MMMMVTVVYDDGGGSGAWGEWGGGSGRSVDEDNIWCSPEKSAGKVFRRRLTGKGGGSGVAGGRNLWEGRERVYEYVCVEKCSSIFDDEPTHKVQNNNDNYNVFAMENEHPEQLEPSNDIYLTEQGDSNITIDSSDICYDRAQDDQDETDDLDQERDLLAFLMSETKCEIEDFKTKNKSLESSNNHFKEANNELSKTNQLMFKDLKKFQAELDKYKDVNYASKVEIDCAKAKGDLMSYKIDFEKSSNAYTQQINDLNQTISDMKKELCAHQETISIMSQAKEAQIKLYKTREDKELDKVIALENKVKFLRKLKERIPRLYDIGFYNDNLALMSAPDSDEMIRLEKERRSKLSDLIRPFDYDKLNNLYDWFVPQREKSPEQYYFPKTNLGINGTTLEKVSISKSRTMSKNFESLQKHAINLELDLQHCKEKIKQDKSFKENQSNVFLKEREQYFEIQDLKAQLQDKGIAISELKKLIEKMKGKSVETKFEKSSVIRQPNAFKSQRQSILGKPAIFSDSLAKKDFSKLKTVTKQNVSNDFSKPVTAQILPQNMLPIVKNTNAIALGMYKVHTKPTQTRTPQPQAYVKASEDRVMYNNSQGKKQKVEDHRRKFKFSNNKTSVTACNDSLNAKTSNVNFVCVTCGKCVLNDNHDLCVLHYINGVNSRTRQPMAVPISTREPKHNVNQSVATSSKKTVATDSTVKKSRNITRKLYEQLVEIILFIVDSGCSKHMTGNLKLLTNFVEKFLGTVKFGNDQIATIILVMEILLHPSDLKGNDLLNGVREHRFVFHYCFKIPNITQSICLMLKQTASQAWLWHHDYSRYTWTHFLRTKDETSGVLIDFLTLVQRGLHAQVTTIRTDKGTEFLNKTLHAYLAKEGIRHETSTARTPEQNGIVEKQNHHVSSDPGPQCLTTVLEQDSLSPGPQSPENVPQVAETMSKSSAVHAADNPDKRQQHNTTHTSTTTDVADPPPLNIHSTHQTPTQVPTVTST
ncbi:retrovirus-related pol polyprotein from transposon TNT 1-94 [Tanacetum coccineum]